MSKKQSILLLNCLGSYFYRIICSVSEMEREYVLLYYLASGSLTYDKLSMDEVRKSYQTNAWGYQPITIKNTFGQAVSIDDTFFSYLKHHHNIDVTLIDMNADHNLVPYLWELAGNPCLFGIFNVDEYYLPESPQFYLKCHNKHFLLVKNIDIEKATVEIIDSEKNQTYLLPFEQLEKAVYCSTYKRKIFFKVNCDSYMDNIDNENVLKQFLRSGYSGEYIDKLLFEMHTKLNINNNESDYFYRGYYYTIQSKIIPYIYMIYCLLKDNHIDFYKEVGCIATDWKMLCDYMRYKIVKKDFYLGPVIDKIKKIQTKEEKMMVLYDELRKNL